MKTKFKLLTLLFVAALTFTSCEKEDIVESDRLSKIEAAKIIKSQLEFGEFEKSNFKSIVDAMFNQNKGSGGGPSAPVDIHCSGGNGNNATVAWEDSNGNHWVTFPDGDSVSIEWYNVDLHCSFINHF